MTQKHALREPMVWLVFLLPAMVVVAGIATLVIAIRSGGNDAVLDSVQRTAQIQVAQLGPEERARSLGLSAVLQVHDDGIELLPVNGKFERGTALRLILAHPSRASDDREFALQPSANGWHVAQAIDGTHDWQIIVAPQGNAWRIHGRLPATQRAAHLASSLEMASPEGGG